MYQINTITKKFTEAVTIDLGQLPTVDTRIDFILTDGTNPVIAENKTFAMTIGSVLGSLYKTDEDTVSFRYLKFNDDNIADSLVITMTMDGVEILNDTVSMKYQRCGGGGSVQVDTELNESSPNPVANSTLTPIINGKADAQAPVSYETLNQSVKRFDLDGCKYSTEYNTKENVSGTFYLYGNNPSPDNVVVSPGETYDYPDLTIEYTLKESLTIKDTDSIELLLYSSPNGGYSETRTIARIYHGDDVIREGIYFYYWPSNSASNTSYKTFSFENILKNGDFQYEIGDTLKIVILSRLTNRGNGNSTLYFSNANCASNLTRLYINNTFLPWQKINNIEDAINQYAQRPTYNMSYTTSSYSGSYTIYLSNDYFTYNDPVNYSLGSDTTFDFDNVTNAGFLFKTGSDFTYTVVENSSYPMVVNKPVDFKPDKTYLIVIYYNMFFWTEVEDYASSSSGN